MPRIAALELLLDRGIGVRPERAQVLRLLHRAVVRRQDVEGNRKAALTEAERSRHLDEVSEARGQLGGIRLVISEAARLPRRELLARGQRSVEKVRQRPP